MSERQPIGETGKNPHASAAIAPTPPETIVSRYHIPASSREHPAVQEFVQLAEGATLAPNRMRLATSRELFAAPDMTIPLQDRYAVANALLVAAREILSEGLHDVPDDPTPYVLRKLEGAVSRLGYTMHLEKRPPVVYRDPDE